MPLLIHPAELKKESERLKTFRSWSCKYLDAKDLARIGFYYTGTNDIVVCAFCNVDIGEWGEGDDPISDHKLWSKNCKFINGDECGNIPLDKNEGVDGISSSLECVQIGYEILPFSGPERSNLNRDIENLVKDNNKPKYPTLSAIESRIKTFETWPKSEILSPMKLAEAGFYFTKIHDNTMCFFCGGGLKHWNASSDPWVDHAAMYSKCGFVRSQKDEKFIQDAISKKPPILSGNNVEALLSSMESLGTTIENKLFQEAKGKEQLETKNMAKVAGTSDSSTANALRNCLRFSNSEEAKLCRICFVNERNIVLDPCGHFVLCKDCITSLSSCPICRKTYKAVIRAYL